MQLRMKIKTKIHTSPITCKKDLIFFEFYFKGRVEGRGLHEYSKIGLSVVWSSDLLNVHERFWKINSKE